MASTDDTALAPQTGTTRRTVLRAGAHAAWMIPAVQVVSQVPALAAVSAGLVATGGSFKDASTYVFTGNSVKNTNAVKPTTGLTATVTMTSSGLGWTGVGGAAPTGWSAPTISPSLHSGTTITLTYTASSQLPANSTALNFNPTITFLTRPAKHNVTISVHYSATIGSQSSTADTGVALSNG